MRFLVYLVTILLFSTAVAQNPTILQGNYITNVFGQANFIKNPNALLLGSSTTNNPNVTTSSATVTRSTTTPLVATSEFTVTTSTSSGFAEWQTRAFDQGMKNQICEARFIYRGFSTGTTTAQVYRGSAAIAQQVLTPSTDAQTVSITFPCGDLAATPTFRLQQSGANLTGVNEIGGIYMGLATNLSTVAQATLAGATEYSGCAAQFSVTSSSYAAFPAVASCTLNNFGAATTSTKDLSVTIPNAQPGWYLIVANILPYTSAVNSSCYWSIREDTSGYLSGSTYSNPSTGFGVSALGASQLSAVYNNTLTTTRTWRVVARSAGTLSSCSVDPNVNYGTPLISVYRFPTASETVLTPNVTSSWGGVVYTNQNQTLFTGVAPSGTRSYYNSASWNQTTLLKGKAQVSTTNGGNALGFSIPNLPAGRYKVEFSGLLGAHNNASASVGAWTYCNFYIRETTTGTDIARQSHQDHSYSSGVTDETRDYINSFAGIFDNTSVGTRDFIIEAMKFQDNTSGSGGGCQAFSQTTASNYNTNLTFLLTPLDYQLPLPIFIDQTPYTVTATSLSVATAPYARVEASGAGTTITLFGCTASTKGYSVEVKRVDASNNITVSRSGSDTIDGATTDLLAVNFQATQYVCNGSGGWRRF